MIKTFKSKGLAAFWESGKTSKLAVQDKARVRRIQVILAALDAASAPRDMDLPGLRFHSLAPGMPGRYSLMVTGNYRITFAWDNGAVDVDLEDYH